MLHNRDIQKAINWLSVNIGPITQHGLFSTEGRGWRVNPIIRFNAEGMGFQEKEGPSWTIIIEDKYLAMQATLMFSDVARIKSQKVRQNKSKDK